MPDGKILEITPDENPKLRISTDEEMSQQNGTDTIEWLYVDIIVTVYTLYCNIQIIISYLDRFYN